MIMINTKRGYHHLTGYDSYVINVTHARNITPTKYE